MANNILSEQTQRLCRAEEKPTVLCSIKTNDRKKEGRAVTLRPFCSVYSTLL